MNLLILNQLGTPDSPSPVDVGRYLKEFLMDPYIISLPRPFSDLLVKGLIVPIRKYKSAMKYSKIWLKDGSPLLVNTTELQKRIIQDIGSDWEVCTVMRYGRSGYDEILEKKLGKAYEKIVFLPLYPQYSTATVESALAKFESYVPHLNCKLLVRSKFFYNQDWYLDAICKIIKANLQPDEFLLLSYHGIPVSQNSRGTHSYFDQCIETSNLIVERIGRSSSQEFATSFQSRVGFMKWLSPSTEETLELLAARGVKKVKIACPSFVADCLETLEEIGIEAKEKFISLGGTSCELIPCLNESIEFSKGIAKYAKAIS